VSDIPPDALSQMKAGAQKLAQSPNEPPRDKLPPDAQRMRAWALAQVGHVAAAVNPFENEELAGLRAERAKSEHPLGDMPLIVLTRGKSEEEGPDGKAFEAEHRRDHAAMAAMSRNGKLIIAEHSGHHVQIDEPELVIKAIRDTLAGTRK
jgi:pimeloyl-ACP methyl ester carboxylesterase